MSYHRCFRLLVALIALIAAPLSHAGSPVVLVQSVDDGYNLVSPIVGTPATQTITLTLNLNGNPSYDMANLKPPVLAGANAADFAIVGGTCGTATNTLLDSTSMPSCTVIVRYTPPTTTAETAQLNISCTTTAAVGGFSITCDNTTKSISLFGSALAAAQAVSAPVGDPRLLTMLAMVLAGAGTYFAMRRNG